MKLSSIESYQTVFGIKTTNPFYIYKDYKSTMVPFYYSDGGMAIVCAMSWGQTADSDASFCALTLDYEGEPLIGAVYGSWGGSTTTKCTNQVYYGSSQPICKISYGANSGSNCGGTWGKNSGYLKTEWTNTSKRAGNTGDNLIINGSRTDKYINSGYFHFGSDDSNKSGDTTLEWSEIPTWSSSYTFCGGSGIDASSNSYWKFNNINSTVASFAVTSTSACVPFINSSRGSSAYLRVQNRINVAPTAAWESHAIYNMSKSITGQATTSTKDKPRDPLWCRISYWPYEYQSSKGNTAPGDTTKWKNSAMIPVGALQTETLISALNVNGTICNYTIWSGCPIYKISKNSTDCKFDITINKGWDAGSDIKFKLRFCTNQAGFSKSEVTSGYTEKYKVDGVENNGNDWITSGPHSIELTDGAENNDVVWISWITDTAGDGGKLTACSDEIICNIET